MDKRIQIAVTGKIATKTCDTIYVCGNSDYTVDFVFDDDWKDFPVKTARFVPGNDQKPIEVVFEGTTCAVPKIKNTQQFRVGVYAGDLRTTTPAIVPAKKSILCFGGSPEAPSDDMYAQIMELLNKLSVSGTGSSLPDPQGAHLQLVTDENGNWTQKPQLAYDYTEIGELFPESELPVQGGQFISPSPLSGKLVIGASYAVTINGVEHQTTAKTAELDGVAVPVLGNTAYAGGEDTREPFFVAAVPDDLLEVTGGIALVGAVDPYSEATVTIRITGMREIVKGIDKKYLGNLRGQKEIILTPVEDFDGYVASVPHEIAWAMDEAELQNAIKIDGSEGAYGSGMSVCAVSKVTAGNMRAIQMLCMGFNDFYAHKWVVLQWYGGNQVPVYTINALMPENRHDEMAVPMIQEKRGAAAAVPVSTFKHLIGVAELNVQITKNDDGSYSSSHQSGQIYGAHLDGVQVKAALIGGFAPLTLKPLYIGETCVFTGVSYTDDGTDGMIPQAVLVTVTNSEVIVEIIDLAEREKVKELEQGLVTLSEEIAALKGETKLVASGHYESEKSNDVYSYYEVSAGENYTLQISNRITPKGEPSVYLFLDDGSYINLKEYEELENGDYIRHITIPEKCVRIRIYSNLKGFSSVSFDWALYKNESSFDERLEALTVELRKVDLMSTFNRTTSRIFKRVLCCGDSYTSGHISLNGDTTSTNEDFAWPHYMSLITGNEWINCGCSGCNVLTWQTHERGLPAAQSAGKVQAYVIGLMLNDASETNRAVELGTAADIGTDAQTYYGGMSAIIRQLNAISPDAKIFVNTCPNPNEKYASYNQAVRDIVAAYQDTYPVHCIDLYAVKDYYTNTSLTDDAVGGHYTAVGYEQFAEIYSYVLSSYINKHVSAFQNVHQIEYDANCE